MIRIIIEDVSGNLRESLKKDMVRMQKAIASSANVLASMFQTAYRENIAQSGGRLGRLADGLNVTTSVSVLRAVIETKHDRPYANVFEEGADIVGNLLWIPLSGTDAEGIRAKDYPGGLFSIKRPSGRPLLFSISDREPKYFGIGHVTIPKKWNLAGVQQSVLGNFQSVFDEAWRTAGK